MVAVVVHVVAVVVLAVVFVRREIDSRNLVREGGEERSCTV